MKSRPVQKEVAVLTDAGFRRMAYVEWGPPRADKTIVCVHGVSRTGRDFDVLAASLAARGARVVAPDLPGRGRSEWLPPGVDYSDHLYRGAMAALIARLDVESVDWVGTSLGGHIGMMVAAEPASPVSKLVLNDLGARISAAALRRIGAYLSKTWRFDSMADAESHLRDIHAPFGLCGDDWWRHLTETSVVPDGAGRFRFHYDPAIAARFAIPMWFDITMWPLWSQVRCPVLLLRGADSDLLSLETVEQMRERRSRPHDGEFRFVEFEGCGHAPSLTTDERIAPIVDFLFGDVGAARPAARKAARGSPSLRAAA